jgi:phosphate-selective porin OprO/OprP
MRVLAALLLLAAASAAEEQTRDQSLEAEVEEYLDRTEFDLRTSWQAAPEFRGDAGDTRFIVRARGLMDGYGASADNWDSRLHENGLFIRQTRLGTIGRIRRNFIYMMELELSSGSASPRDIWVGLRDVIGVAHLKLGNMRDPFGLDGVTPIPFHMFMERAVSGRAFGLGRNYAIRLEGAPLDKRLFWMVGWYRKRNGWASTTGPGGYSVSARVAGSVIRDHDDRRLLSVQLSFTWRSPSDHAARFRARAGPAAGPRIVDTGEFASDSEYRFALAVVYRTGPFTVQAEGYVSNNSGLGTDATFHGLYAMAQYWLTGETFTFHESDAAWARVVPNANFQDGTGGRGAWAIALRYDHTDLTDGGIDGGEADSFTFDVTWLWNPNMRVKLNLVWADVVGGPHGSSTVTYLMTRFQFDF